MLIEMLKIATLFSFLAYSCAHEAINGAVGGNRVLVLLGSGIAESDYSLFFGSLRGKVLVFAYFFDLK